VKIDLKEVNLTLVNLEKKIAEARARHNGFLKELEVEEV